MDRGEMAITLALITALLPLCAVALSSSCPFSDGEEHHDHHEPKDDHHAHIHHHGHSHHHHEDQSPSHHDHNHGPELGQHDCGHDHASDHSHEHSPGVRLAEEIAEEEELELYGFKSQAFWEEKLGHGGAVSSVGLWLRAMGCSLLVSMASLICLILLPFIVAHGKPSRIVVDFLAAFGAGAMLGDAFLHQLPHALGNGGGHKHSHGSVHRHAHDSHDHHHDDGQVEESHGHAHSIEDLSVGLAILAGILLFFIVEKIVRQVEKSSSNGNLPWSHSHHHHHHHHSKEHTNGTKTVEEKASLLTYDKDNDKDEDKDVGKNTHGELRMEKHENHDGEKIKLENCKTKKDGKEEDNSQETTPLLENAGLYENKLLDTSAPNLVLGYLNLFSDGVHNFTDGMALGSAFVNHGTLGGWSRTLFLLAHELPQEVGDFGILVQSGFSVLQALAFNFLSALVALAGTSMALLLGGTPGHSSLIEGFTAGGFIYIAVAGVLPEMHQYGTSARTTVVQLVALGLGMSVALFISLVE